VRPPSRAARPRAPRRPSRRRTSAACLRPGSGNAGKSSLMRDQRNRRAALDQQARVTDRGRRRDWFTVSPGPCAAPRPHRFLLPRGCHTQRDQRGSRGTNRDNRST
jgi:hypothetical protein